MPNSELTIYLLDLNHQPRRTPFWLFILILFSVLLLPKPRRQALKDLDQTEPITLLKKPKE